MVGLPKAKLFTKGAAAEYVSRIVKKFSIQSKIIFTGKLNLKSFYEEYSHLNVHAFITNNLNKEQLSACYQISADQLPFL